MTEHQRLIRFITRANWVLFALSTVLSVIFAPPAFTRGVLFGGLLVTVNFHLLARTLRKSLVPSKLVSHNRVLAKYYLRFAISGIIIAFLIIERIVNPIGLVLGLSVVVASIMLATIVEVKHLICKEAV